MPITLTKDERLELEGRVGSRGGRTGAVLSWACRTARLEYVRNGTLSLFAAFNAQSGVVLGTTVDHHTSREFLAFLRSRPERTPGLSDDSLIFTSP